MDRRSEIVDCGTQCTRHFRRCCARKETQIDYEQFTLGCMCVYSSGFLIKSYCSIFAVPIAEKAWLFMYITKQQSTKCITKNHTIRRKLPYKLFHSTYRCRSALLTLGKTLSRAHSKCNSEIAGMVLALMEDKLPCDRMATSRTGPIEASWQRDRMSAPIAKKYRNSYKLVHLREKK